jgi:hypothetical protein
VAHGVSNTLAFVLIYFDRYPGLLATVSACGYIGTPI